MVSHVRVEKVKGAEACDLCARQAQLKMTNGAFFVLLTCLECWEDLKRRAATTAGTAIT